MKTVTDELESHKEEHACMVSMVQRVTRQLAEQAQRVAKRDQFLEIVCAHEDVQWQSEELFRQRLQDQARRRQRRATRRSWQTMH